MVYKAPNTDGSKVQFKSRYGNLIGGEWKEPAKGQYFENISPVNGKPFCEVPRSTAADIEKALDAAHAAKGTWGKTSTTERSNILNKIADRIEANLEMLAVAETWDNGKPVRETLAADMPLTIDHFRYFASAIRAQEGHTSQLDENTVAYHFQEPLGVVGQIIPWNFPILMAAWKLAPALAAGNAVVIKPAEQTPTSLLVLAELIQDLLPPGVLNIVNGFGVEAGKPLASNKRISKIAFTGETTTGRLIMQYASENLIPVTLELGGKSPNVFFDDVFAKNDDFAEKVLEGFGMFALNQGEVCTCPSRAIIDEKIYGQFMERAIARAQKHLPGNPLDPATTVGAQASRDQLEKILSYLDIGKKEGAKVLMGGEQAKLSGDLAGGFYVMPTVFQGHNKMRVFQEEIFGPVVSATTFKDFDDAISIANDTLYGLGAGVWTRDGTQAYRAGRAIEAGRVWTNCYHHYPAHAAFGGYKQSGIGRENHKMMLDHYQQTKNLLVSYDPKPMGFFDSIRDREMGTVNRVDVTPEAADLIRDLAKESGPLMFHQSGGCCDGSAPMCFPLGDFKVGGQDVLLGEIAGCPFYMSASQFEYWKHTHLTIDVVPGRGAGFSLEAPRGVRFLTRSRILSNDELAALPEPLQGDQVEG